MEILIERSQDEFILCVNLNDKYPLTSTLANSYTFPQMRKVRYCAFCPNKPVLHGGEHIFDDWLNKWLPVALYTAKFRSLHGGKREFKSIGLNEKLPVVCEGCNSRWMSVLTERFKDSFRYALRDASALCILPSGVALLAAFTFMKAVVSDVGIPENNDPFFSISARRRFGISLDLPPVGIKMWIGAFQGFEGESLYSHKSCPYILSGTGPMKGLQFFGYTYVVGRLVLQLCASRWKNVNNRGRRSVPMLKPSRDWDDAAIQFWPSDGSPITWPPPKYLGSQVIQQFIDRFKLRVELPIRP